MRPTTLTACECGCGRIGRGQYRRGHRPRWEIRDEGHTTECWIWAGARNQHGYGHSWSGALGRTTGAHRAVYLERGGVIPPGLELDHLCRNRACVNPDHLEPVTRGTNVRRSALTPLDECKVAAIRASPLGYGRLGRQYGVSASCIRDIKKGISWA